MYIATIEDLNRVLTERRIRRPNIRTALDAWVENEFGIPNFTAMRDDFFGIAGNSTAFTLCRQIASLTVEHISAAIVARALGFSFLSPSFVEDIFCSNNTEKRSYVHVTWSDYGRKGSTFFRGERIVGESFEALSNVPLNIIRVAPRIGNETVPDFHGRLRKEMFGESVVPDVSEFHRMCVRQATKKPRTLFVFNGQKTEKMAISDVDLSQSNFRPSAEWYYPLFQAWFLDGSMALLENYDYAKDGKGAEMLFEHSGRTLRDATGQLPVVLRIPTEDSLLSIPRRIIRFPETILCFAERFSGRKEGDFSSLFAEVADAIFGWRE